MAKKDMKKKESGLEEAPHSESPKVSGRLEARVREDYKMGTVMAFSGAEFSPKEWRLVPVGQEDAALAHPLLEVREVGTEKIMTPTANQNLPVNTTANQELNSPSDEEK